MLLTVKQEKIRNAALRRQGVPRAGQPSMAKFFASEAADRIFLVPAERKMGTGR
jgi:hypothetical protein